MLLEKVGPIDTRTEAQRVRDSIKDFFKKNKLSNKSVAEKLGISQPMFTYYFSGNAFLPQKIAKKLNQLYGFDEYYLMKGSVEFVVDDNTGDTFPISHNLYGIEELQEAPYEDVLDPEEAKKRIKNLIRRLSTMQKKYLLAEEALYSANRIILSISNELEQIAYNLGNQSQQ